MMYDSIDLGILQAKLCLISLVIVILELRMIYVMCA